MLLKDYPQVIKELDGVLQISLDTETTDLEFYKLQMMGFSFAYKHGNSYASYYCENNSNSLLFLKELIKRKVIFHNAKFDLGVLQTVGIDIPKYEDTYLMAGIIDERQELGLKSLVKKNFNYDMMTYEQVKSGKESFNLVDINLIAKYASDDALYTYKLYEILKLLMTDKLEKVYRVIELPLAQVLSWMEQSGSRIDSQYLDDVALACKTIMNRLEKEIHNETGNLDLSSPKQLAYFLYEDLKIECPTLTKKKGKSTNRATLEKIIHRHPLIEKICEYKDYDIIQKTFVPGLKPKYKDLTFPSFSALGTVTGRLSSQRPNFQNLPRQADKLAFRKTVIAREGHKLIVADYSQIELRILAHCTDDPLLIAAYIEGKDIHQQTADICGCSRDNGKAINFGLVYGMGIKALAERLDVSFDAAKQFHTRFFETYKHIKKHRVLVEEILKKSKCTKTLFGRIRHFDFNVNSKEQLFAAFRSAYNFIIQGSCADMMKLSMVNIYSSLKQAGCFIYATVHDELVISCPKHLVENISEVIRDKMTNVTKLKVPIEVSIGIGNNWYEAKQ